MAMYEVYQDGEPTPFDLPAAPVIVPTATAVKPCNRCAQEKPLYEFQYSRRDGYSAGCKACLNAVQNARYAKNHPPKPKTVTEQRCTKCEQVKPLEQFDKNPNGRYGRATHCKECRRQENKNRYQVPVVIYSDKVCSICGITKPVEEFRCNSRTRDGRTTACKDCLNTLQNARYKEQHPEPAERSRLSPEERTRRRRIAVRRYQDAHPDKVKEWARSSYARHRESRLARSRERYAADSTSKREINRRYYENNKEKVNAANRAYYEEHKEDIIAYVLQWRRENPDKVVQYQQTYRHDNLEAYAAYARLRAARKRQAEGFHTVDDILMLYEEQEGQCYYCTVPLDYTYHVDHKQPVSRGGSEWPSNLCCACVRCNTRKGARTEQEFKDLLSQSITQREETT